MPIVINLEYRIGIISGLGYFCAETMFKKLQQARDYQEYIIVFLGAVGLLYCFIHKRKKVSS